VQAAAASRQGAGQDAVGGHDDLDELGVDAQGDALPGEVDHDADLLADDADASAGAHQAGDFDDGACGQRPRADAVATRLIQISRALRTQQHIAHASR